MEIDGIDYRGSRLTSFKPQNDSERRTHLRRGTCEGGSDEHPKNLTVALAASPSAEVPSEVLKIQPTN